MKLVDVLARLLRMEAPVFATADAAAHLGARSALVSTMLARLAGAGHLVKLGRARWAVPGQASALQAGHLLTAPFPAYVSLQTALFHHGMISQMPEVIYVVSLARTQRRATPLGTFSIHHVQPAFFFGYAVLADGVTQMAVPEKALLDFLYLAPARSKLFRALPELELPAGFSVRRARAMLLRLPATPRRTHALRLLARISSSAAKP
jgi:predicted transcriptional regulator of viral defense system